MKGVRPDPNPARARFVAEYLDNMRKDEGVSVRELCRRTGKTARFFDDLMEGVEVLTFEDFVSIVQALECDPSDAMDDIVNFGPRD